MFVVSYLEAADSGAVKDQEGGMGFCFLRVCATEVLECVRLRVL